MGQSKEDNMAFRNRGKGSLWLERPQTIELKGTEKLEQAQEL